MRKHVRNVAVTTFLVVILWACGISYVQAQDLPQVRMCTETELTMPSGDRSLEGLQWIIGQSFDAMSWPWTLQRKPWQKCLQAVQEGRSQGLFAIIWTPERDQLFAFPAGAHHPNPDVFLWEARYHLFENVSRPVDLQNLRFGIGAPLGYVVYKELKQRGMLSNIDYTLREGLMMVARGRLDGYVAGEIVGMEMLTELKLSEKVVMKPKIFLASQVHAVFGKRFAARYPHQVREFWQHMNRFRSLVKANPALIPGQ